MEIKVLQKVLDRNRDMAATVRAKLKEKKLLMINLISSPGAGKTSLLEFLGEALAGKVRMAVIEGDVATDRDAIRLKRFGFPVVLINTDGGCHLDSHSISVALKELDLDNLDLIFVENVGNLVCPAHFDLGESFKLAIVSTTEGDDKPIKYPMVFRDARAVVLNKTDLLPYTRFKRDVFLNDLHGINPSVPLFELSCVTMQGVEAFKSWLLDQINEWISA
jgi:hydrogenase nickel incorporation protein HypB